ncbi:type IV pilus assembly protein PilM [Candidatus Wolfebacteria bacterium]|nr:type IV pilus assembly protein PilM [Candidatus Wolfebacteria bacterium]
MAHFLETLKETVSGSFAHKGDSVLGIDVSSSTIKVVQLRKKGGRALLETYGELALGPYAGIEPGKATQLPPEKMAQALRDLMHEAKVTTNRCGVAIPLSASLINIIQMPDVGEKRLADMVSIEMRKYIPVSISEVMLDWRVIPRGEGEESEETKESSAPVERVGMTDVLVVAIHKDTLARYQQIIEDAGLQTSFFEIEVFSTVRAVLDGAATPTMLVDIGAGTTKIFIVDHRVLRESHIINRGSQDITLALSKSLGVSMEKALELKHAYGLSPDTRDKNVQETIRLVLDSILIEAVRVMRAYQEHYRKNVGQVIMTGGGSGLKGLAPAAEVVLETPATVADPFAKVTAPAFLQDVLTQVGPEFAVSIGVALRRLDEES